MHRECKKYCQSVAQRFPEKFTGKTVLDCGSLDINGNNRYLFTNCNYTGIDICKGPNVDIVTSVSHFHPPHPFDVVISTEMLEHDRHLSLSLPAMFDLLRPGGLLLLTAAGIDRKEHGTFNFDPQSSPATNDYYSPVLASHLTYFLNLEKFSWYELSYFNTDIRFSGIKRLF